MNDPVVDEALMTAVEDHDVMRVKTTLAEGANPNYVKPWEGDTTHQPNTPLRMVVFRISDNLLEERDLIKFSEIASLLLQYGADPKPALHLAELRYGKYDPNAIPDPFNHVLRIIMQAAQ
jgi:hypothetical protein